MKKRVAILGSTGSIGKQALDVVRKNPDHFEIEVLTAYNNIDLLSKQAKEFQPNTVVIANESKYDELVTALGDLPVKIYAGNDAIAQIVEMETIDIVLTAMVGYSGLLPTINAIKAGKTIALANKETLVVAGEIIQKLAFHHKVSIYPVDSEHSAIFQCLVGEGQNAIEKIILTASGGPFRGKDIEFLKSATKENALKHPNWDMGAKITIDSATMMNKGLEAIEARWLFGLNPNQIEVVVHPQSIIHSAVQFEDGSMKAQMGLPDMKLPILYALSFPDRIKTDFPRFNFWDYPELTFEKPDLKSFRNLALAFEAMDKCGNMPCILNAANEIAVEAFLKDKIGFCEMTEIIEQSMQKITYIKHPALDDLINTDKETREFSKSIINKS
ncbi:MAG: 1-deoxy-D-xylulose-5-phosphate reductoisomerase [Bacteroidales bacterium]|nr:1-deoxy-D-xylulose-5-phosphate reductoisomerase [Bacteroidales bacterium]